MFLTAMHVRAPDASAVGDVAHLYFHGRPRTATLPFDLDERSVEWVSQECPGEPVGGRSTLTTQGNLVLAYLDLVAPDDIDSTVLKNAINSFLFHLEARNAGDETRLVYEWPSLGTERAYALKAYGKKAHVDRLALLLPELHSTQTERWARQAEPVTLWVSTSSTGTRIELDDDDRARLHALSKAPTPPARSFTVTDQNHADLLRTQRFDALALDAVLRTLTGLTPAQLLPLGGFQIKTRGADQADFVWPGRSP